MMTGSVERDGAEAGGAPPPPSSSALEAAAVVIMVSSSETERSVGEVGGPKVCVADAAGGCKVLVDEQEQQQGKGAVAKDGGSGDWDRDEVCRICHLSPCHGPEGTELIQLGCGCKGELGAAHRDCAEAWFRLKGNRCCEICGANAKNITGEEDACFMEGWHGGSVRSGSDGGNINSSERGGCWRGQPFCNFLMACLVIAFILPWFFRVNMF